MTDTAFHGSRSVDLDGTRLAYREQGEGPPVVFVHGAISDLRTWDPQLPAIGARYRAIGYSRRYARPNQDIAPGGDDPILTHVEDLARLLSAVDATPAHLVGNSWGALIGLFTAIRHPEMVRSLVLAEPPAMSLLGLSLPPRPSELLSLPIRHPKAALGFAGMALTTLPRFQGAIRRGDDVAMTRAFAIAAVGRGAYDALPEARKQQMAENASTLHALSRGEGLPPLTEDEVRGVAVPSLVAGGRNSPSFYTPILDRLEALLPAGERAAIPGASHLMHEENAPAFNAEVSAFLDRLAR